MSSVQGQTKSVWRPWDVMQVVVNPGQDQPETNRVFVLLIPELGVPCSGAGRVTGMAKKLAGDLDVEGQEYCLVSDGRGLRSHCRIPAVLVQDQLLKV